MISHSSKIASSCPMWRGYAGILLIITKDVYPGDGSIPTTMPRSPPI